MANKNFNQSVLFEKSIRKNDETEIKLTVQKAKNGDLYVDIREWVDTEGYKGPTKKGTRFYVGDNNWMNFLKVLDEADEIIEEFL